MLFRYFAVTCEHGHHGAHRFMPITFAISAYNAPDACERARMMPGVKHGRAVLSCREIPYEEYIQMRKQSAYERSRFK